MKFSSTNALRFSDWDWRLDGFGSTTSGIDIEFIDQIDNRKKYCQLKSGPNSLNKDDVTTIINHFKSVKNLAKTNNIKIGYGDLIFALTYGEKEEINAFIKELRANDIEVFVGKEFWHRLTGDIDFYNDLIKASGEVAKEVNMKEVVDSVIKELANGIENRYKELFG